MTQAFISHSTGDSRFARRLAKSLRFNKVAVWLAQDRIAPGMGWIEAIDRGLGESTHLLAVLTPRALESPRVRQETYSALHLASQGRLVFIPLDVEDCKVPPLWAGFQAISFRDSFEEGLATLLVALGMVPTLGEGRRWSQLTARIEELADGSGHSTEGHGVVEHSHASGGAGSLLEVLPDLLPVIQGLGTFLSATRDWVEDVTWAFEHADAILDARVNGIMKGGPGDPGHGIDLRAGKEVKPDVLTAALAEMMTDLSATDTKLSATGTSTLASILAARLAPGGKPTGLVYAQFPPGHSPFRASQRAFLEFLSGLVSARLETERLRAAERTLQHVTRQLMSAAEVQTRLYSRNLPTASGYQFSRILRSSLGLSGDFGDIVALDEHHHAIVVGDVAGFGAAAALFMAATWATLMALLRSHSNPVEVMVQLNQVLVEYSGGRSFVTLFLGILDSRSHNLTYVSAGAPPPLLIKNQEGKCGFVPLTTGGMLVGILPAATYESGSVELAAGDVLCVFTDGIPEASRADTEFYGENRIVESVWRRFLQPLEVIAAGVMSDADEFLGGASAQDDQTLLLVRRSPGW